MSDISNEATIYITLRNDADVGLNQNNDLVFRQRIMSKSAQVINLGKFTKKRCEELKEYLDRLAIHVE